MGWNIGPSDEVKWKSANADAQAREDAIKSPGVIPKEDFWQPGEWSKWLDIEKDLLSKRKEALRHRQQSLFPQVKKLIQEAYAPEDGQELSDAAVNNVSKSIVGTVVVFNALPPGIMAVTDEEKQQVLNRYWLTEERKDRYVSEEETCPWTVVSHWDWIYQCLIDEALEGTPARPGPPGPELPDVDGEEVSRLVEAKKKKEHTNGVLASEVKLDAKRLKAHSAVIQDIAEWINTKNVLYLDGLTKDHMHYSIDSAIRSGYLRRDMADKLKSYFDSDEKARAFSELEHGWSKGLTKVKAESDLLESLAKDLTFVGKWLDFVYKEADLEQTEKVRDVNEKVNMLYANGRHALAMNLV